MKTLISIARLRWPLCTACAVLSFGLSAAGAEDGPVAAVQQSLQRQQYYSGAISGEYDEATRAAVRRFQIRRGFKVTGELDAATLEGLAAGERALQGQPEDYVPPQEVPARERARAVVQEDREFLAEFEQAEKPAASAPAETLRTSPPPPRPPATRERTQDGAPVEVEVEVKPRPAARESSREVATTERVVTPAPPARAAQVREEESAQPPRAARISSEQARQMVEDYLQAAVGPTPEREVSFYADEVNYFDEGRISRAAVARDQRAYYRRWPERQFTLLGEPEVLRTTDDGATVRYRLRYQLRSGEESARGETENVVRLRREGDRLRIASIRERKLK